MRRARSTELVTAATQHSLKLEEAKRHLRVEADDTGEDQYIKTLISVAEATVEKLTWRKMISSTWKTHYDCFPMVIELPFGSLTSVSAIQYYDVSNVQQTLATSEYQVDSVRNVARVMPVSTSSWPDVYDRMNAISVQFVCGYSDRDSVPMPLKQAMLLLIGHYMENREEVVVGVVANEIKFGFDALISPYSLAEL